MRVNVESRALAESRFLNLARALKKNRLETLGLLVVFWHDTQERRVVRASKPEILKLLPPEIDDRESCFTALLENDYLKQSGKYFEIAGNARHVRFLDGQKQKAQKAGWASAERRKKQIYIKEIEPAGSKLNPNAIQFNAVQFNTEEENADPNGSSYVPPPEGSSGLEKVGRAEIEREAYSAYPRKEGKRRGLDALSKQVRTRSELERLKAAIERYRRSQNVADGYVKHFSTFAGEWRDWLEPDAGTVDKTVLKNDEWVPPEERDV